jgi:hypothetical protein
MATNRLSYPRVRDFRISPRSWLSFGAARTSNRFRGARFAIRPRQQSVFTCDDSLGVVAPFPSRARQQAVLDVRPQSRNRIH